MEEKEEFAVFRKNRIRGFYVFSKTKAKYHLKAGKDVFNVNRTREGIFAVPFNEGISI